jgi:hypothetical protein
MLSQLMRYAGNLEANFGVPRSSCHANFITNNDDDNVVDAFKLILVNVDAMEPTDVAGDNGIPFLVVTTTEIHIKQVRCHATNLQSQDIAHQKYGKKVPKDQVKLDELTWKKFTLR